MFGICPGTQTLSQCFVLFFCGIQALTLSFSSFKHSAFHAAAATYNKQEKKKPESINQLGAHAMCLEGSSVWETHSALFVNWKVPRPWMSRASGRRRTSGASVKHGCALEEGKMLNCVGKSSRHG